MTTQANKHPNAVKLDASRVPPWTHKVTLEMEGYPALQESISAGEYKDSGILKSYYVQGSTAPELRKAGRVVSVLAKHLRLSGNPLVWVLLSGLLHEQRIQYLNRDVASVSDVLKTRGTGYIAIPDFYTVPRPAEVWSRSDMDDVGNFLATHVYYGGGLILGGLPPDTEGAEDFGIEMADMLHKRFVLQSIAKGNV
jgi:hypothetical protein